MMQDRESGSALVYILIAIALLAALTATFMNAPDQQGERQGEFNTVEQLQSQIAFIRTAIDQCVLTYAEGDSGLPINPVSGQNVNRPYPLMPENGYLLNPSSVEVNLVGEIGCPGNPGNSNNHVKIFGGASAKFLPATPRLFEPWDYYNNTDGVYFITRTDKTDAYIKTSLQKLNKKFSNCEADIIDAVDGVKVITSDGLECDAGFLCFRIWIRPNATAIYPDEGTCP